MINFNDTQIFAATDISSNIINSLKMLITTPVGTVALDRDYGLDMSFCDMPLHRAKQKFSTELITKIRKYEPRVQIKKIEFIAVATNDKITPKITLIQA